MKPEYLAAVCFAAGAAILLVRWLELRIKFKRTRASVFANLDNAYAGGHFEPGGVAHGLTAEEITEDLLMFAADYEQGYYAVDIKPHVRAWMRQKGLL